MSSQVVIALGGNVGDTKKVLQYSTELIEEKIGIVTKQSSLYITKAWGVTNQPDFVNQVIVVNSKLKPEEVLSECLNIEYEIGRRRIKNERWEQRIIDLDILFYDLIEFNSKNLVIPHPLLHERNFVLYPLAEILPEFIHPTLHKSIFELKKICNDTLMVEKM